MRYFHEDRLSAEGWPVLRLKIIEMTISGADTLGAGKGQVHVDVCQSRLVRSDQGCDLWSPHFCAKQVVRCSKAIGRSGATKIGQRWRSGVGYGQHMMT